MKKLFLAALLLALGLGTISPAFAAVKVQSMEGIELKEDFVVGPGKTELLVDPGQTAVKTITIINRYSREKKFKIELEDFQGSSADTGGPIQMLGLTRGPYSLRDYIQPEVMEFSLQPKDRITIPVRISTPKDAVPGGLYGSLLVSVVNDPNDPEITPGMANSAIDIKTRIAVLYFVRVKGPADENGQLVSFKAEHKFYFNVKPVNLITTYQNKGNVYLNPKGSIEIKNMYGSSVDVLTITPYYVLPASSRTMKQAWDRPFMLGRYKATLTQYNGYLDKKDDPTIKSYAFWVIPWKIILGFIIGLIIIVAVIKGIAGWIKKNFQRRK